MSSAIYYIKEGELSFGAKNIFSDIELYLNKEDRVCLVGRNGSGKSSLMKVICGDYDLDLGTYYLEPHARIGYLQQDMKIPKQGNVYDFVIEGISTQEKSFKADIILQQLGLTGKEQISNLSGGQIRRVHLAKALVEEPEILLLDEPTNHLDIALIEWLEEYIKSYSGAVICISHDRAFLNNVTNKIWWLDRGVLRKSDKGFKYFEEWQDQILQIEESSLKKLDKKMQAENLWLQQGVTGRRKRNQGRLAQLRLLREHLKSKTSSMAVAKQKMDPFTTDQAKKTKFIIEMDKVSFSYDFKIMLNEFSFKVQKGEKIGIIGPNGSGKSSFIKLLVKELIPTSGKIRYGNFLEISYFDQYRSTLNKEHSIKQILCPNGADHIYFANGKDMHVATYLKKFMFNPKELDTKVSTLSGGEANRLLLAKTLINPGNLLILDEPTNDLDMDSLEILLEILSEFDGTAIVVSHDRDFLERLVTRTLVFEGQGKIIDLVGGYQDYLQFYKSKEIAPKLQKETKSVQAKPKSISSKLSYKDQRLLIIIPTQIEELENENITLEIELANPDLYSKNPDRYTNISDKLSANKEKISEMTEKWIELEEVSNDTK
jgi:ATP-binding cassette subfamily F protein uup